MKQIFLILSLIVCASIARAAPAQKLLTWVEINQLHSDEPDTKVKVLVTGEVLTYTCQSASACKLSKRSRINIHKIAALATLIQQALEAPADTSSGHIAHCMAMPSEVHKYYVVGTDGKDVQLGEARIPCGGNKMKNGAAAELASALDLLAN